MARAATVALAWVWSSSAGAEVVSEQLVALRADGSKIAAMVVRPDASAKLPILMYIDGSMCIPSMLGESATFLRDGLEGRRARYALVVVEKPSPTQPPTDADGGYSIGPEFTCSADFKKHYSIDDRTTDHLRIIAALRRHAPWWNGRLLLWGHSDGARVAARLAAYVPETSRVVLGGMGGGRPMATDFEDVHICAVERTEDRPQCIEELRKQFASMRSEPSPSRTWNGDSNTWKAWASRLDAVETNVLIDATAPIRMYHGVVDGSNPVESARMLVRDLKAAGGPSINLVEVPGMDHGLGAQLDPATGARLHREFLDWLLAGR